MNSTYLSERPEEHEQRERGRVGGGRQGRQDGKIRRGEDDPDADAYGDLEPDGPRAARGLGHGGHEPEPEEDAAPPDPELGAVAVRLRDAEAGDDGWRPDGDEETEEVYARREGGRVFACLVVYGQVIWGARG